MPTHQRLMCEALERVEATPDARLIITMPPRHAKSETASVTFPTWCLGRGFTGRGPIRRVGIACYGQEFAEDFSATVLQRFADEDGYARDVFNVAPENGRAKRWHLAGAPMTHPSLIAVGIGGQFTGRGVDLLIIDDPVKTAAEAYSPTYRDATWNWWQMVARTRLQPGGRCVVIMTRWHADDLAGRLLEKGGWEVLHMPALSEDGAALWPAQYPVEALEAIRQDVGPTAWQALYQGAPVATEGAIWRREWFDPYMYDESLSVPYLDPVITAWDTAFETGQENDYTAWVRMGYCAATGHYWVLDAGHRRVEYDELVRLVEAGRGGEDHETAVIERKASGHSARQTLKRVSTRPVVGISADVDKAARARAVSLLAEAGKVRLPKGAAWTEVLLGELTNFPRGKDDDMHDAFVHALAYLRGKSGQANLAVVAGIGG